MKKLSAMFMTLLAVATMSANTFTKVTSAPEDWSGQYLVVYEKSATEAWVFNGKDEAQDYVTATIADGQIVSDDLDQYAVTVATMSGGYSVKAGAQYMGGDASKNTIKFNAQPILNTISMDSVVYFTSNTSVLRFNPTSTISNNKETGIRFRYYKSTTYTKQKGFQLYKGTVEPVITKIDTIGVTEARARIDAGKSSPCYVYGVVATAPSDPGSYKNTIFWMTDIENPNDSLEGYKISGLNGADIPTIDDIPFEMGDTIMIFASDLKLYNKSIYETEGGYFVEMLGKNSIVNVTSTYKFAFGAVSAGAEVAPFPYEVVLSKEDESNENALHFMINTKEAKGIVGTYTIGGESYADNGQESTPISGSLKISFKEEDGNYNKYDVVALFSMDGGTYRIDSTYAILGWYSDLTETFPLVDDKPFIPTDDQEITCAQAQEYALQVLEEGAESGIHVFVIGYANNAYEPSGTQQSFYMDDVVGGKKVVQSYYGNLPAGKKVINGAKVRLSGYLQHYVKNNEHTAEIKNGTIEILEGGEEMKREVVLEQIPDGALTVAEAKALTDKLSMKDAQHSDTSDVVVVKGYVTKLYNSFQNGNQSFYMDDVPATGDAYYDFEAFKCSLADYVVIGDEVFVEGRLVKYVGTSKSGGTYTNYNIVNCTGHFVALSTALREIAAKMPATQTKKVLYRGKLYIMRAGAIFDVNGNKMN